MKNVTLSIPDDLLIQSRKYAKDHGTTLNEFIRELLRKSVRDKENSTSKKLDEIATKYPINTSKWKWNRDEIYER